MGSPLSHPKIDTLLLLQDQPSWLLLLPRPYPASALRSCSSLEATAFMSLFSGTVSRTPALDSLSLLATPHPHHSYSDLQLHTLWGAGAGCHPYPLPRPGSSLGFPFFTLLGHTPDKAPPPHRSPLTTQASLFPNKQGHDPPPRVWDNEVVVGDSLQALFRLVPVLRQILEDQPWVSGGENQTDHSPGEGCQACKERPCVKRTGLELRSFLRSK